MNLDDIKRRIATATRYEWRGEVVYLRKIGATDGMAMVTKVSGLNGSSLSKDEDRTATLDFHARAIAKSLSDADGVLQIDSQYGIDTLKQLPFDDLVALGDLVLKHSGFGGDEKKSTQPTNSPPSDSALNSESSTPITSSAV